MPVTVVVGGQFGSEGKGKVAHWLAQHRPAKFVVRIGGSNSGHTAYDQFGNPKPLRHLPTAALLDSTISLIGPGSYLDADVLLNEIRDLGLSPDRLIIDPNAFLITEAHKEAEANAKLNERIGSTVSGTGAAVVERISRSKDSKFVKSNKELSSYVRCTREVLTRALTDGKRILIEGTQGFGLSLLHSGFFPNVTSRDTTAAGFLSEVGLSPLHVDEVAMVLRAFPIRVAGNSGPLSNETTWQDVTRNSGKELPIFERTTVTKKLRRVATFDPSLVIEAIKVNAPNVIFLNHVDYIGDDEERREFVRMVESNIGQVIDFVGMGPDSVRTREDFFQSNLISAS